MSFTAIFALLLQIKFRAFYLKPTFVTKYRKFSFILTSSEKSHIVHTHTHTEFQKLFL